MDSPLAWWVRAFLAWDVWLTGAADPERIAARAEERFGELLAFVRERSPFYAERCRALPANARELREVPPVTRGALMARFDDWVTDRRITFASARAFASDPRLVGQPYLGSYALWTSSGTSGEPGIFVLDEVALAVHDALEALRLGRGPFAQESLVGMLLGGGRYAMIAATGGHFAGVASVERLRRLAPLLADRLQVFSILEPLARTVARLNAYRPDCLATYPTVAELLAREQEQGRLAIRPSVVWLGGETLSGRLRARVQGTFGCRVIEEYGASECMSIACGCERGNLHVNSDWVLLEPVDRSYRPVAPGTMSHTVLVTNLANRVQPLIRCDLGDSVVLDERPCACGSPFPVIRVHGRSDDVLEFEDAHGAPVALPPLALTTVVEECGIYRFQIVQAAPDALDVRLEEDGRAGKRAARWRRVERALRSYLEAQGLAAIVLRLDPAPLETCGAGGKLRRVLVRRRG